MGKITGYWIGDWQYNCWDSETGQLQTVTIPMPEIYERNELDEIEHWARERAGEDFAEALANPKPKLTKQQQNDLGKTLMDVRASRQYKAEHSDHGRYW
jgi:hypothetical protein